MSDRGEATSGILVSSVRAGRQPLLGPLRRTLLFSSAVLCVLLAIVCRFDGFVEGVYARHVGPAIARGLGAASGLLPFSLAEFIVAALVLRFVGGVLFGLFHILTGRGRPLDLILRGGLRLLTALLVLVALFYALWGVGYARRPLAERLGWDALENPSGGLRTELDALCAHLVEKANELRAGLPQTPAGMAAARNEESLGRILDEAYGRVAEELQLGRVFAAERGPAKTVLLSPLMSRLGISGFYFPWTGEANIDGEVPLWQRVHAVAHEKAHQRGITSEDEANLFGFLACAAADDPFVRYCGYLFAQRQLLRQLAREDPERVRALVKRRLPAVQANVSAVIAFWRARAGWAMDAGTALNDRFLRLNRVRGGIRSYALSSRLLVLFARSRGGSLDWGR